LVLPFRSIRSKAIYRRRYSVLTSSRWKSPDEVALRTHRGFCFVFLSDNFVTPVWFAAETQAIATTFTEANRVLPTVNMLRL